MTPDIPKLDINVVEESKWAVWVQDDFIARQFIL